MFEKDSMVEKPCKAGREFFAERKLCTVGKSGLGRMAVKWRSRLQAFKEDESGAGVIEVLLILVVLIAVVILFKEQIMELAELIFGDMFAKAESVF